ncbi:MAG: hypothetical protein AABX07_04275 [Nanoarchaeota archaeon]
MKKRVWGGIFLLALFGITFLGYSLKFFNLSLTGNVIFLPQNIDCSAGSVQGVWDSIFKESSNGIFIYTNISSGKCLAYSAYKNNSNELYLLRGIVNSSNPSTGSTTNYFIAIYANATDSYLQNGAYKGNISADLSISSLLSLSLIESSTNLVPANISSSDMASAPFTAKFKETPTSWSSALLNAPYEMTYYFFNVTNITDVKSAVSTGSVSANYSFARYIYSDIIANVSCNPSWRGINTTCINNSLTTWFNDTNQCKKLYSLTYTPPVNLTIQCGNTSAGSNILGNDATITKRNLNISVYVNNALVNFTANYTNQYYVDLKENDIKRVSFLYVFATPLDLRGVVIEKQNSSSDFGYLIVSGLDVQKAVIVDKLNASSSSVCVKNAGILGINEITRYCNGTNEYAIKCPGNISGFNCTIATARFIVSGLTHSGVREIIDARDCASNWTCGNWSDCINNQQARTCIDSKNCGNSSAKPAEFQTCGPSCASNWTCGNWTPATCPKNGTQSRICTDKNNCTTIAGKPSEVQTCTSKKNESFLKILFYTFLIIVALLALAVLIFLIKNLMKAEEASEDNNKVFIKGPLEGS